MLNSQAIAQMTAVQTQAAVSAVESSSEVHLSLTRAGHGPIVHRSRLHVTSTNDTPVPAETEAPTLQVVGDLAVHSTLDLSSHPYIPVESYKSAMAHLQYPHGMIGRTKSLMAQHTDHSHQLPPRDMMPIPAGTYGSIEDQKAVGAIVALCTAILLVVMLLGLSFRRFNARYARRDYEDIEDVEIERVSMK